MDNKLIRDTFRDYSAPGISSEVRDLILFGMQFKMGISILTVEIPVLDALAEDLGGF